LKELKGQLVSALLLIVTAASLIAAGINFQRQRRSQLPEDGVVWVDRAAPNGSNQVVALHVVEDSAAERAGIREGDVLTKISNSPIATETDVARVLARVGAWKQAEYVILRGGIETTARVVVREQAAGLSRYYQYLVGLGYLVIGLFVYMRRARAPRATHFYLLCLISFIACTFHYSGILNNFDKVIFFGNVLGWMFAPTIFLHFCLAFPEPRPWFRRRGMAQMLYLPATAFGLVWAGVTSGTIRVPMSQVELLWVLNRLWLAFVSAGYLAGAATSALAARGIEDPVARQQVKWLRNGAVLGVLPFTCFYTIPFVLGVVPNTYMNMAVLSLIFVPLTWAYAIVRYRLMDVDVIFQQGFAYTLATLGVMGVFYVLVLSKGPFEEMDPSMVAILIMVATFIFQPLRNWLQEVLDRYVFYKDRYDYRRTLVEFAREFSSETDVDHMLSSVADRLRRTLSIRNVAFFLRSEEGDRFELREFAGEDAVQPRETLDLSFLTANPSGPLFFERTRVGLDIITQHWSPSVRATISELDLTYYIPCQVRGKTIAYLGASRTTDNEFLSSEDLELLTTLSGSVGIAIENARLYRSLQRKVEENERLKEFNENIVESLNVGIVAVDLNDRVESWNSQMEELTGVTREQATGQPLTVLLPPAVVESLDGVRGETGVHQFYKIPLRSWSPAPAAGAAGANGANGHGVNGHGEHRNGVNGSGAAQNGRNGGGRPKRTERLVNIAVAPLVTRDQNQIGRLIILDDVTERAELEQRLVQTDKLSSIGLLAAGVAHEVNTPLAVISNYAQMLTRQFSNDDPKTRLLEKIAKQTFRASEIVNSLLNFSRTSKTEFEDVDLNRVIRETLSLVEHQIEKAGITVVMQTDTALPPVKGNFGKLQQVFLNLFLNARDAMEGKGVLRVTTSTDDGRVRVQITDNGKGIPADELPRIYDPFFTTKGAKKGTGLGLAVTYGIVREHGGNIEAQSEPGAGTTFVLDFPQAKKPVHA